MSGWEPVEARFDEMIHSANRPRICAALEPTTHLEFTALEESLGISTSLLSKQLKPLSDACYLALEKGPSWGDTAPGSGSPHEAAGPSSATSTRSETSPETAT